MINLVTVQGSRQTTWHDFSVTQEDMTLTVSAGSYWRDGVELATLAADTVIEIDSPGADVQLELWLTGAGEAAAIELHEQAGTLAELEAAPVDRIAWFTVPAGTETLDEVQINVIQIVEA